MGAPSSNFVGFTTINANLKSIIAASAYIGKDAAGVQQLFDYAPANFNGYPAVVLAQTDENATIADTQRNQYVYTYHVLCLQTRLNLDPDQNTSYSIAESNMRVLVDDLMVRLNTDITVGGIGSTFSRPVKVNWGYIKGQDVDSRTAEISIEVVVGQ